MKLIFAVLDVSLTMGITRCYKTEGFLHLSFTEPELLPIKDLHCGNRQFRVFLRKIVENIKIFRSYRTSDADDAETHFVVHYRQFKLVCCRSYTHLRCYFTPYRLVWSLPVT